MNKKIKKAGIISILVLESDLMIFDEPYAYLDKLSCDTLDYLFSNKKRLLPSSFHLIKKIKLPLIRMRFRV